MNEPNESPKPDVPEAIAPVVADEPSPSVALPPGGPAPDTGAPAPRPAGRTGAEVAAVAMAALGALAFFGYFALSMTRSEEEARAMKHTAPALVEGALFAWAAFGMARREPGSFTLVARLHLVGAVFWAAALALSWDVFKAAMTGDVPIVGVIATAIPGAAILFHVAGVIVSSAASKRADEALQLEARRWDIGGDRLGVPYGSTRRIWEPQGHKPSFVFLAGLSIFSLASDIVTKLWAEKRLAEFPQMIEVWKGHVDLVLAKNRGGAWGLLQGTSENVRRPFFLLVSVAAIAFIVTLYRRLQPRQRALKWGLPLVLGGALGNVFDRIRYGHVIDFIDVHMMYGGQDHHWPTFNVADVAICLGVGLMAIDMFTSRKKPLFVFSPPVPPAQSGETSMQFAGVPTTYPALDGATAKPAPEPAPPPASATKTE